MTLPFRRRSDTQGPHERARLAAAARLDAPLAPDEAEWLEQHLAECPGCTVVADSYLADRLQLRALRDRAPEPPRDLWARTAAAIEAEAARSAGRTAQGARRPPLLHRMRPSPVPLGAISGALVVAVVVGASLLSQQPIPTVAPPNKTPPLTGQTQAPGRSADPGRTPIAVAGVDVDWAVATDGKVEIHTSNIDEVCAAGEGPDCAPIDQGNSLTVQLPATEVDSIIQSPNDSELVLVDAAAGDDGGSVLVVPVPTPEVDPSTPPSAPPTDTPSPPVTSPTPSVPVSQPPSIEPTESDPVDPSQDPSGEPPPSGSLDPSGEPGPIEIARDVIMVGESAGYSADGAWFAFSARPADGSHGPDIYVWQAGMPTAVPITDDHNSVFSTWIDGRLLASRAVLDVTSIPADSATAGVFRPQAFLVDPATGDETILEGVPAWRPAVDPDRRLAVYWDGTLQLDPERLEWQPAEGRLVLGRWPEMPAPPVDPLASGAPDLSSPSVAPSASLPTPPIDGSNAPPAPKLEDPIVVLNEGPVTNWDARWDEDGTHLAVWVADQFDPTYGLLTLRVLDAETGEPQSEKPELVKFAKPGFSIGDGRLVWATRGGEDGLGGKVKVVAWTKDAIGSVETSGGDEKVIIIR